MNTERPNIAQSSGVPPEEYGAFKEVMESMTPSENLVVEQIAARVNARIAGIAGAAPATPFYASPGVIVTGCALVVGITTWAVWPSSDSVQDQPIADQSNEIVVEDTHQPTQPGENDFVMTSEVDSANMHSNVVHNPTEDNPVVPNDPTETASGQGSGDNSNTNNQTNPEDVGGNTAATGPASNGSSDNDTPDTAGRMIPKDKPYYGGNLEPAGGYYTNSTYMGTNQLLVVNVKVMQKMGVDDPMKMEDMPSFYGGDKGIEEYVRNEMKQSLLTNPRLKGQSCVIAFQVNQKGKISEKEIVSADSGALRAEMERIFSNMPNWQKGAKKGKISVMLHVKFDEKY